jgi:hypothetical protein
MKKSVVATIAWRSLSWKTAASSEVSMPTSRPSVSEARCSRRAQDLAQHGRRDLAAATAAVAELGETKRDAIGSVHGRPVEFGSTSRGRSEPAAAWPDDAHLTG